LAGNNLAHVLARPQQMPRATCRLVFDSRSPRMSIRSRSSRQLVAAKRHRAERPAVRLPDPALISLSASSTRGSMSSPVTCSRFTNRQDLIHPRIVEKLKAWSKSTEAENLGTPGTISSVTRRICPRASPLPILALYWRGSRRRTKPPLARNALSSMTERSLAFGATLPRSSR
jgi:hypothetical protein